MTCNLQVYCFFFCYRRRAPSNPDSPISNHTGPETIHHVQSATTQTAYLPTRLVVNKVHFYCHEKRIILNPERSAASSV